MLKEPMLASKAEEVGLHALPYPALVSPKIDGYRAVIDDAVLRSKSMKLVPNKHVNSVLSREEFTGLDGELCIGPPNHELVFNRTSAIRRIAGEPDFKLWAFDDFTAPGTFEQRYAVTQTRVAALKSQGFPVAMVKHFWVNSPKELIDFETKCLLAGYEGVMVRHRHGPYREGRSTASEGWLFKMKRFVDFEAEIIGFKEKMHNDNPAFLDERGRTKRTGHQENKRAADTLGGLVLRRLSDGMQFHAPMGKGWPDDKKNALWLARERALGRIVVVTSQPIGEKDRPRVPKVKAFREAFDM